MAALHILLYYGSPTLDVPINAARHPPPVRCRKSARFFQKLPFRTGGAGEKTRFLLKKSAGIRPKSAVTHWKSALENI